MLQLNKKVHKSVTPDSRLVLSFEQRSRSRLRAQLEDNRDVAVALKRGSRLFPGDILESDSGEHIVVVAAKEKVSEVQSTDHLSLARICYHLGNRHVALQIGEGFLRYLNDHVLDDMVERLGLKVIVKDDVFEPESGAYGEHAHVHSH